MIQSIFCAHQLKILHCDMPTTSPCGGPQPLQILPKCGKKLKKSHPRHMHGQQRVPPLKQAKNFEHSRLWRNLHRRPRISVFGASLGQTARHVNFCTEDQESWSSVQVWDRRQDKSIFAPKTENLGLWCKFGTDGKTSQLLLNSLQ